MSQEVEIIKERKEERISIEKKRVSKGKSRKSEINIILERCRDR